LEIATVGYVKGFLVAAAAVYVVTRILPRFGL
jgi:hypothetical protein